MDPDVALENLVLAREVFVSVGVRYFLMHSTLLGLTRNGGFIEWDPDMDIGVFAEDFTRATFVRYIFVMRNMGFSLQFLGGQWGKYFQACWSRNGVQFDIPFYYRRDDKRVTFSFDPHEVIEFSFPAPLLEELVPVAFGGESFMAPKDKEAVLAYEYGDWQVPKPDWDWRTDPLNLTHRRKRTALELWRSRFSYYPLRRIWNVAGGLRFPVR